MFSLFNIDVKVFNRHLEPDNAGGDFITFEESGRSWRVRMSTFDGNYVEDIPGREYPSRVRIIGDVRSDIRDGDRIEHAGVTWELISVVLVNGVGTIPDYIRARATRIGKGDD
jgi:hypothetical protein